MSGFSDTYEQSILSHVFCADVVGTIMTRPTVIYIALHIADPSDSGLLNTELTGGSYIRQHVTFLPAASDESGRGYVTNRIEVNFRSLPSGTVTHVGLWDAGTEGSLIISGGISSISATPSESIVLNTGDELAILAETLKIYLD